MTENDGNTIYSVIVRVGVIFVPLNMYFILMHSYAVPPTVSLVLPSTVLALVDGNVTLEFNILDASPVVKPENIYWTFETSNGTVSIEPTFQYEFSADRLSLTIRDISHENEGFYTFLASNPAGLDEARLFLQVEGKIIIPPAHMHTSYG